MIADLLDAFMQPQLSFGEEAELDSLVQLFSPPEVGYLSLPACPPISHVSHVHQYQIHHPEAHSGLSGLPQSTILCQRLSTVLRWLKFGWDPKVSISVSPFASTSPEPLLTQASLLTVPYGSDNFPAWSPNLWHRYRAAQRHQYDRPGSFDADRGDLGHAERHDTVDPARNDYHEDPSKHAPHNAQNLTKQPVARRNPSFMLSYRDPPRTPRPSASPPARAPPEAFVTAEEPAVSSSASASGRSCVHSEPLLDINKLSCDSRTRVDRHARTRRYDTTLAVAQCKISASPKSYGGLAIAGAADSCSNTVLLSQSSPLHKNTCFVVAAGEQSKGKAPDEPLPHSKARASSTQGKQQANKTKPSHPLGSDNSDNEQNSDGEDQEQDDGAQEEGPRKKRKTSLPFRCPKHAADPDGCDPKCGKWSSDDIASVTRHAKKDAKDTPDKLARIKSLKSTKFSPSERWTAYYDIFGEGKDDLPAPQPYFGISGTSDNVLLQIFNTHPELRSAGCERILAFISEYERLKDERIQRDRATELKKQRLIQTIYEQIDGELKVSDARFERELSAAIQGVSKIQLGSSQLHATRSDVLNSMQSQTTQEDELRYTGGATAGRTPNIRHLDDFDEHSGAHHQRPRKVPEAPPLYSALDHSDSVAPYGQLSREHMDEHIAAEEVRFKNPNAMRPDCGVSQPAQRGQQHQNSAMASLLRFSSSRSAIRLTTLLGYLVLVS
ncbi:hypothetical protein H2200_005864 [Cladophialophora chaetospira]|uniref:Uncharacterized protein n=1 Tax=Cladophialophora chaetospira TaxID=386627 RepID=A0AA39CIT4_9EURO|nr:hypothetical protein H2200_005864 [Cladophialophora chaetospira]